MTPGSHTTAARQAAISWMLILAFLSLTLFPQHYHMHHVTDAVMHEAGMPEHVIDIHGHMEIDDITHHEDGHTITPATDVSLKTPGIQLPWVAILVTFLLLLPLLVQEGRQRRLSVMRRLPRFNRHSIPPLRAPPHA